MTFKRFVVFASLAGSVLAFIGGFLISSALVMKPSSFRLVKMGSGRTDVAICLDAKKVEAGFGGPLVVSDEPCPDMKGTGPTPQIEATHPTRAKLGLLFICLGFVSQCLSGGLRSSIHERNQAADPVYTAVYRAENRSW